MSSPEQYLKKIINKSNKKELKEFRTNLKKEIEEGVRQNIDMGFTLKEIKLSISLKAIERGFPNSLILIICTWTEKEYKRYIKGEETE